MRLQLQFYITNSIMYVGGVQKNFQWEHLQNSHNFVPTHMCECYDVWTGLNKSIA